MTGPSDHLSYLEYTIKMIQMIETWFNETTSCYVVITA